MADLDYAAWPLWCGSLGAKADRRLAAQLAYHFCRIDFGDDELCKGLQEALVPLANEFHRVGESGIPPIKERGVTPHIRPNLKTAIVGVEPNRIHYISRS